MKPKVKKDKTMKEKILNLVKSNGGGTSFVELQNGINGFVGKYAFSSERLAEKNIWMWFTCSNEAVDALSELVKERKIFLKATSFWVYLVDGCVPGIPMAKQSRKYKKERWLPTVLNIEKS